MLVYTFLLQSDHAFNPALGQTWRRQFVPGSLVRFPRRASMLRNSVHRESSFFHIHNSNSTDVWVHMRYWVHHSMTSCTRIFWYVFVCFSFLHTISSSTWWGVQQHRNENRCYNQVPFPLSKRAFIMVSVNGVPNSISAFTLDLEVHHKNKRMNTPFPPRLYSAFMQTSCVFFDWLIYFESQMSQWLRSRMYPLCLKRNLIKFQQVHPLFWPWPKERVHTRKYLKSFCSSGSIGLALNTGFVIVNKSHVLKPMKTLLKHIFIKNIWAFVRCMFVAEPDNVTPQTTITAWSAGCLDHQLAAKACFQETT